MGGEYMPRPPNEKCDVAKKQFLEGKRLIDIAHDLGVPAGTVRRWKSMQNWDAVKKNETNVRKKTERKQGVHYGAPFGNKNAVGNNGGAPKGNKNAVTHGAYETILFEALTTEEIDLVTEEFDEERLLIREIQLLNVREVRMLKRIQVLQDKASMDKKGLIQIGGTSSIVKDETDPERTVKSRQEARRIDTVVQNKEDPVILIQKIEVELTKVQKEKARCIDMLYKLRKDKKRVDMLDEAETSISDIQGETVNVSVYLPSNGREK